MPALDYTIIVPSRKRAHNMPVIRGLLPTAVVCIDQREVGTYPVDDAHLLVHPPMDRGLPQVLNWVLDTVTTPIIVIVDDDLLGVQVTVGSQRYLQDPEEILAVIENSMRACHDLSLTTFCWSRTPNTSVIHPEYRPIVPVQSVCNARGFMGAARHRKFDEHLHGRADVDWTMRTLLEDRAIYTDVRFYFDCGPIYSGAGGSVGMITPEVFERSSRGLRHRWGKHLTFKPPGYVKSKNVTSMGIRVSRTNKAAQK